MHDWFWSHSGSKIIMVNPLFSLKTYLHEPNSDIKVIKVVTPTCFKSNGSDCIFSIIAEMTAVGRPKALKGMSI